MECLGQTWKQLSKSTHQKFVNLFPTAEKATNFLFYLLSFAWKVSWLIQKIFTGVSFCDTKGPCKHWAKTECCFPNQPPQNWSISLECVNRVQISNFIGFFVWKVISLRQSFPQEFYFVTLKGCRMCLPKLNAAFQISPLKVGKFVLSRQVGSSFKFYWFLFRER